MEEVHLAEVLVIFVSFWLGDGEAWIAFNLIPFASKSQHERWHCFIGWTIWYPYCYTNFLRWQNRILNRGKNSPKNLYRVTWCWGHWPPMQLAPRSWKQDPRKFADEGFLSGVLKFWMFSLGSFLVYICVGSIQVFSFELREFLL